MRFKQLFVLVCASILFFACKGEKNVTPSTTKITGPLGEYYEIVDQTYTIADGVLYIEIKKVSDWGGPEKWTPKANPTFKIEILDQNGAVLDERNADSGYSGESYNKVFALNEGESANMKFEYLKKYKDAVTFKVYSMWDDDKYCDEIYGREEDSTSSNSSKGSSVSEGLEDIVNETVNAVSEAIDEVASMSGDDSIDDYLDSYEDFVDDYISLLRKAKEGDLSALSEYPAMMNKAQNVANKLTSVQGNMSVSQANRFAKIQKKIQNAAQ